jgi:L-alanine-DL-glutamate epimerase-like enolase superfamily enzyme
MKIVAVRCFQVAGPADYGRTPERKVDPLDIYPEMGDRLPVDRSPGGEIVATYVAVRADDGVTGLFGPIFEETALLIKTRLAGHLVGRDPLAYELLWDVLIRQDRHARSGHELLAISAVDCALWDLRGKLLGQPVYRLLGGPTRTRVDCYVSLLGEPLDPGLVRERAREVVESGYRAQKWFFRHGPSDGPEGMARNVELVRTVREAVGPDVEIMFDCSMAWDASYTIRMLERIAEFRPRWLEEPVLPDLIAEMASIRRSTRIPIATGEHEYTRWGFHRLLQADAADVLQPDPEWCGGISELVKICTLASTYGRQVFPHGHSLFAALHVIAAQPPGTCPMLEFLANYQPPAQHFHLDYVEPRAGALELPTTPGLGIELDEAKIERRLEL